MTDTFVSNLQLVQDDASKDGLLNVDEVWTYTATHQVTQAEIDAGADIVNTATADSDQTGPVSDDASVPVTQRPAIYVDKAFAGVTGGNGNALADAKDDVLNYTVTVYNTGNRTLTGVSVVDPMLKNLVLVADAASGDGELDVGEAWTYSGSYTLTQDDLDNNGGGNGALENTATGDTDQTEPMSDTEVVPLFVRSAISLNKELVSITGGNGNAVADAPNDLLRYAITVTNAGTVTLTNVALEDDPAADFTAVLIDTLAPGESQTYYAEHTLTQAEIDNNGGGDGFIDNVARTRSDQTPDWLSDDESVPVVRSIAMGLDERLASITGGNSNSLADWAGDVLRFSFNVTNAGNVTLNNVRVTDTLGLDQVFASIAPGATAVAYLDYTLTQDDLDNRGTGASGYLRNVSVATSTETNSTLVVDGESVTLVYSPRVDLTKYVSVDGGSTWLDANTPGGSPLLQGSGNYPQYKFKVSNVGNITLQGVEVSDSRYDLNGGDPGTTHSFGTLTPRQTLQWIYTGATYEAGVQGDSATVTVMGMPTVTDVDNAYYTGI
ncbi:MAG: hypothetical protein ACKOCJ_00055 [Burkholderiaceae bacterium]